MALENHKPIYAPAVIDFITAAAAYCKLVENLRDEDRRSFLTQVTRLLPLVYVKATQLPYMEAVGDERLPLAVTEADYDAVRRDVWSLLRAGDDYLEVFTDVMQWSEEPVTASVSELLADIYQDLKNFVAVYADTNEVAMNNAVVEVQDTFVHYWGQKLVNVMRPLHQLLYAPAPDGSDEADGCDCGHDGCDCGHDHDGCDCGHGHDGCDCGDDGCDCGHGDGHHHHHHHHH